MAARYSSNLRRSRPKALKSDSLDHVRSSSGRIVEFLLEHMGHGFLMRDAQGSIVFANDSFASMIGADVANLVDINARDLVPGLRDGDGDYESEIVTTTGKHRIMSVVTSSRTGGGYMDLISEIRADRALRDRLVAEVQRVSKLAQTDSLTGQANRAEFASELERLSERDPGEPFGVAIVDLDDFKEVNDRYGHPAGDAVLIEFSSRLRHAVRDTDLVARLGGDEFAVLLVGAPREIVENLVDRLIAKLSFSMQIGNESVPIQASVGWAHSDESGEEIFEVADRRMYLEKRRKKGR